MRAGGHLFSCAKYSHRSCLISTRPAMMKTDEDIFSLNSKTPTVLSGTVDPTRNYEKVQAFSKAEAKAANRAEHEQTVRQAFQTNKKAVFWSFVISMAIIMEGYDTALIPQFFGYPSFQQRYGQFYPDIGQYSLNGVWQAALSNGQALGVIVGGFINGWASAKYGYKKTMLAALFWINSTIFVVFFAPHIWVLLIGQFLCGLGWGVFATTGPAYASEVCPLAMRGYLTVYNNLCWAMGQLLANGVLKALVNNKTQWSYRIPFAVQWAWPLPLFILVCFSPESPWWLAKQERYADAAISLHRLSSRPESEVQNTLSQIVYTIRLEKARIARRQAATASAPETQSLPTRQTYLSRLVSRKSVCRPYFLAPVLFKSPFVQVPKAPPVFPSTQRAADQTWMVRNSNQGLRIEIVFADSTDDVPRSAVWHLLVRCSPVRSLRMGPHISTSKPGCLPTTPTDWLLCPPRWLS